MIGKLKPVEIGCLAISFVVLAGLGFLLLGWVILPSDPVKTAEGLLRTKLPPGTKAASRGGSGPGLPIPGGASDGYIWLILQVPRHEATNLAKTISNSPLWKQLPLPPELAAGEKYLQPSHFDGVKGHIPLETAAGYYLLIDFQAEWNEKHNPRPPYKTSLPIWERPSMDYTFGVFDEKTGRIYVWHINT
jgi:hypothetical protein